MVDMDSYQEVTKKEYKHKKNFSANIKLKQQNQETILIQDMCFESYPCQHYVKIGDLKTELTSGYDIFIMLKKQGYQAIPKHFLEYENFTGMSIFD